MEKLAKNKSIQIQGFEISYNSNTSALSTIEGIFIDKQYPIELTIDQPNIIDAGSNIGIATLYFKSLYPKSKITCFEPDPNAFDKLKLNIKQNKLTNIDVYNYALSNSTDKEISFYGCMTGDEPDARGNSIVKEWGLQRDNSSTIKIKTTNLSKYIDSTVDFLKLDIEAAELQVLQDLEENDKLKFCKIIAIEVHESLKISKENNLNAIISILEKNNFNCEIDEKEVSGLMPEEVSKWVKENKPKLIMVLATQK